MHKIWFKSKIIAVIALCLASLSTQAGVIDFSVFPSDGEISGAPGSTVGWGYSITNNSSNYVVTTAINADLFQYGVPLSIFDFPVINPGSTVTKAFSVDISGLFQFLVSNDSPIDFINSGLFILSSEFYTNDPLENGSFISSANDVVAFYSIKTVENTSSVPEPASLILLLAGLSILGVRNIRSRF